MRSPTPGEFPEPSADARMLLQYTCGLAVPFNATSDALKPLWTDLESFFYIFKNIYKVHLLVPNIWHLECPSLHLYGTFLSL